MALAPHLVPAPATGSLFEAIVGTVRQPLLALDGELRVRLANRAFREFFGSARDVEGQSLFELGDGFWNVPELRALLDEVVATQTVLEDYAVEATPPGQGVRSLLVNARRLDVNGEQLILLAVQDVTELEESERLVTERTAELEAFNYSVSHDLRAPLRALNGFSRAVQEDCADQLGAEGRRYLGLIQANATQMGALIDGLLAFSRLGRQGMARHEVDVRVLVGDVLEVLAPDFEGRSVEVVLGDLPACCADPVLLRQVFANLLGNALKFTRTRERARLEIGSRLDGDERVWFVRDNGVGFELEFADRIFDTFHRLHRSDEYEGTGIGLALVRRIVERHGGRIWVEAAPGEGATFSFTVSEEAL